MSVNLIAVILMGAVIAWRIYLWADRKIKLIILGYIEVQKEINRRQMIGEWPIKGVSCDQADINS